jgi:hypothetical protein
MPARAAAAPTHVLHHVRRRPGDSEGMSTPKLSNNELTIRARSSFLEELPATVDRSSQLYDLIHREAVALVDAARATTVPIRYQTAVEHIAEHPDRDDLFGPGVNDKLAEITDRLLEELSARAYSAQSGFLYDIAMYSWGDLFKVARPVVSDNEIGSAREQLAYALGEYTVPSHSTPLAIKMRQINIELADSATGRDRHGDLWLTRNALNRATINRTPPIVFGSTDSSLTWTIASRGTASARAFFTEVLEAFTR